MAFVYVTIWRLHSFVFNELDLSSLLFLLRVVDAGQNYQSPSRKICKGYARWAYNELCLPICSRHNVGNELGFEHTGQNWISFFRLWTIENLRKMGTLVINDRILSHTIQSSRRFDIAILEITERLILRSSEVIILPSFWFWTTIYTARFVYKRYYQWVLLSVVDRDGRTKARYRGLGLLDLPSLDTSICIRQLRRIVSPPANPHASFKTPPSGLEFRPGPTPK